MVVYLEEGLSDWMAFMLALTKNGYGVLWRIIEDEGKKYARIEILEKE